MKKFIAITAGLFFLGIASPAQASDTCDTLIVSVCTGDSGLSLSVPNPNAAPPAAPTTQPQAATPAPAAPRETPGPVAATPKPANKINTSSPNKVNTPEVQPTTTAPTSHPSTPTAGPTKTRVVTKYVKTTAKWKIPVIAVVAVMSLIVTVMYVMYRIGWREAELKFNEYILEVWRSSRRRKKRKFPLAVDSSASLS